MDISLERAICSIYPISVRNRDVPPSIACNCTLSKLGSESSCVRHSNIAYCNGFCILVAVCTLSADVSLVLLYTVDKISFHHCNYARFKGLAFIRGEKERITFCGCFAI